MMTGRVDRCTLVCYLLSFIQFRFFRRFFLINVQCRVCVVGISGSFLDVKPDFFRIFSGRLAGRTNRCAHICYLLSFIQFRFSPRFFLITVQCRVCGVGISEFFWIWIRILIVNAVFVMLRMVDYKENVVLYHSLLSQLTTV